MEPSKANAAPVTATKPQESTPQLYLHSWALTPALSLISPLDWLLHRRAGPQQQPCFLDACQSRVPSGGSDSITRNVKEFSSLCLQCACHHGKLFRYQKAAVKRESILRSSDFACLHLILGANVKACRNCPEVQSGPLDCGLQDSRTSLSRVSLKINIMSSCTSYSLGDSLHLPFSS